MRFLGILFLALSFFSCKKEQIEEQSKNLFGTECRVNLYDSGTQKLYDSLFKRLSEIDAIFNPYAPNSEISRINGNSGNEIEISAEFAYVLKTALFVAEATDGAFDPTLGAVVDLWGINNEENEIPINAKIPDEAEIEKRLEKTGWKKIKIETRENRNFLTIPQGFKLDLGGIVKGYAADSVCAILQARKVKSAMLDFGGNVYVFGEKIDKTPWKIGIKNPFDADGLPSLAVSGVCDTAIITSGTYERSFERGGKNFHHIINPETGEPSQSGVLSVTVICRKAVFADALATAFMVMGSEKTFEKLETISYLQEFRGDDRPLAIAITESGKVFASAELKGYAGAILDDFEIEFR